MRATLNPNPKPQTLNPKPQTPTALCPQSEEEMIAFLELNSNLSPSFGCRVNSQFKNNYFTEMCSGSEAGSYLRLVDFRITQL